MAVEVTHVSARGIWVLLDERELFLPYDKFPWFLEAPIAAVLNIEHQGPGRLRWPDLDIDLSVASIEDPTRYPLVARDALSPYNPVHNLPCDFLRRFARFEFALKRGGYAEQEGNRLVVKWRQFARTVEGKFQIEGFRGRVEPLIDRPPERQIKRNDQLDWETEDPPDLITIEWLLAMTYRIRNNLFHGGKLPMDPARDPDLLRAGIETLEIAVSLHWNVEQAYLTSLKSSTLSREE